MSAYLAGIGLLVGLVDSWVLHFWAVGISSSSGGGCLLAAMMGSRLVQGGVPHI